MRKLAIALGLLSFVLLLGLAVTTNSARAQDEAAPAATEEATSDEAEPARAEEAEEAEADDPLATLRKEADILWTCIAAFLVFFMQAGFACVEAGFTRAKNACNIIMKNVMDFGIGSVSFWLVGFGLMFGTKALGGFVGGDDFMFDAKEDMFGWAFLLFQTVFCATAATIVSGAMAERTKFSSYLIYTAMITVFVYPIFGGWAWGGLWDHAGWLEDKGFLDFAGSTVVHSIGGWAALAGAIVLGPRIGKYVNGKVMAIPGHNIPLAALGVFILWLGWFGFNPGSTTAVEGGSLARIAVATNIAAACGALAGTVVSWLKFGKPDVSFALNGALAGLVAITAGCDCIPIPYAALTGLIAGVVVVFSVIFFDKIHIDDPVGAISVHGVCGALGTLAIGFFHEADGLVYGGGASLLGIQALGVGVAFAWAFPVSMGIFLAIKYTVGLRVTAEEEMAGLDIFEHGMAAYPPGFVADSITGTPLTPASMSMGMPSGTAIGSETVKA